MLEIMYQNLHDNVSQSCDRFIKFFDWSNFGILHCKLMICFSFQNYSTHYRYFVGCYIKKKIIDKKIDTENYSFFFNKQK